MSENCEILKAKTKGKKYAYVCKAKGKKRTINFGQLGYSHYKDSTPLKLYSDDDHNDKARQLRWYKRHYKDATLTHEDITQIKKEIMEALKNNEPITPLMASSIFLW